MKSLTLIFVLSISIFASNKQDLALKAKAGELEVLKGYVQSARDSLENEVTGYYAFKQTNIDQREIDKQEFEQVREQQERVANDLSRVKEECLAKEQTIADERKAADGAREEWKFVQSALGDVFKKDADCVMEAFPLDREQRRIAIENIRAGFSSRGSLTSAWDQFTGYLSDDIKRGAAVNICTADILTDQGIPRKLTLARFGNVFAFGVDQSGEPYIINQTGKLGPERFSVEKIGSVELSEYVKSIMPTWLRVGKPSGMIIGEILQNDQSRILVSGKKQSTLEEFYNSMKAGGLVMIPLLLLPLWALWLAVWKVVQLTRRRRNFRSHYKKVLDFIKMGRTDDGLKYIMKRKGAMARILETCLDRKERGRHASERAVQELIMQEAPELNRGINTIAVIAGAAPLLGLLGTISGMISLFAAVTHYGTGDPKFLAGGISEALITAKTGLAIAIPTLFAHDLIRNNKDRLIAELERFSVGAMARIWPEE